VIIVITFNPVSSSRAMVTNVSPIEAGTSLSFDEVDGASSSVVAVDLVDAVDEVAVSFAEAVVDFAPAPSRLMPSAE
jgi:hypothetical protein